MSCSHCGNDETTVTCTLCNEHAYCNAACQEQDWDYHQQYCNVVEVNDLMACNLFADGWETAADQDVLLVQRRVNHDISQVSARALYDTIDAADLAVTDKREGVGVGGDPGNIRMYQITLQVWRGGNAPGNGEQVANEDFMGRVPDDIIFARNEKNRQARQLAVLPFRKRKDRGITYWPDPTKVQNQKVKVPIGGGFYRVTLQDPHNGAKYIVEGEYFNLMAKSSWFQRQLRKVKQRLARTLQIKGIQPTNVIMLSGRDPRTGMAVSLTFDASPKDTEAYLLDIELYKPDRMDSVEQRVEALVQTSGRDVDIENKESVASVVAAVEHALMVHKDELPDSRNDVELMEHMDKLHNIRSILHEYASKEDAPLTAEVHTAMNQLLELTPVDGRLRVNRWRKQLRKDASWAKEKANKWGDEVEQADAKIATLEEIKGEADSAALKAKTWAEIKVLQAKAALARSKRKDLKQAIEEVLRKEGTTLNDSAKELLNEALAML